MKRIDPLTLLLGLLFGYVVIDAVTDRSEVRAEIQQLRYERLQLDRRLDSVATDLVDREVALQLQLDSAYAYLEDLSGLRQMTTAQMNGLRGRIAEGEAYRKALIQTLP